MGARAAAVGRKHGGVPAHYSAGVARIQRKFSRHPLFTDELQFIVGATHPGAQAGRVERSEIPRQNYILYNKQSVTFRLVENYFRRQQMVLNTVIELGSMEATKERERQRENG